MIRRIWQVTVAACLALTASTAHADLRVGTICRVKGQETNTLFGIGLVTGLRGTGDGKSPAALRKLAQVLEGYGTALSRSSSGKLDAADLRDAKNVALVTVSVRIPAHGAQEGERLDCTVTAIAAKSLEGGTLVATALLGRPGEKRVYAIASGKLSIEDLKFPTVAKVAKGARLQETFRNPFQDSDHVTLVLRPPFADFQIAYEVEEVIKHHLEKSLTGVSDSTESMTAATGPGTIVVKVPEYYRNNVVHFISQIMELRVVLLTRPARVVVNEREGTIIVTDNVQIGPVAVSHQNLTVTSGERRVAKFVEVDSRAGTSTTSLQGLLQALDELQVTTSDQIAILRTIYKSGQLYAEFIDNE